MSKLTVEHPSLPLQAEGAHACAPQTGVVDPAPAVREPALVEPQRAFPEDQKTRDMGGWVGPAAVGDLQLEEVALVQRAAGHGGSLHHDDGDDDENGREKGLGKAHGTVADVHGEDAGGNGDADRDGQNHERLKQVAVDHNSKQTPGYSPERHIARDDAHQWQRRGMPGAGIPLSQSTEPAPGLGLKAREPMTPRHG